MCVTVKQVFSEMDFLGWYTVGDAPTSSDIKVHKQVISFSYVFPLMAVWRYLHADLWQKFGVFLIVLLVIKVSHLLNRVFLNVSYMGMCPLLCTTLVCALCCVPYGCVPFTVSHIGVCHL